MTERQRETAKLILHAEGYRRAIESGELEAQDEKLEPLRRRAARYREPEAAADAAEAAELWRAALDARTVPGLQLRLAEYRQRDDTAREIYRITDRKPKWRLSQIARAMGWIEPHRRSRKILAGEIAFHFGILTTRTGTFEDDDGIAILTGPGDSWERKVEGCPLKPWDAIDVLVELYDLKSADACVAALEREKREIEEQRKTLIPYEDTPAVLLRLLTLPTLERLPDRRSTHSSRRRRADN